MVLFAATVFVSAFLLFSVQPMFAKMLLPRLGGAPAVWNTCLVFFQAMLLAGYAYAHLIATRWPVRRQTAVHLLLLSLPLWWLPIRLPPGWSPPVGGNPIPAMLTMMPLVVGVPFLLVSTSAPLLQRWFAHTGHPHAANPYVLYAASNLGSFLALVSYPFLVEPRWRLADQSVLWGFGYVLLMALIAACALLVWRSPVTATAGPSMEAARPPIARSRRGRWILLSAIPSSLMMGVTTYLSTDIAAIPLLWVIPLGLYLLTFVIVFSDAPVLPHRLMARLVPFIMLPVGIAIVSHALRPAWLLMSLHLLLFFTAAMACHGELARDRPPAQHLTDFYLSLALGGVLGGMFNALLAPLIFQTAAEYPIAMILACALLPIDPQDPHATASARWLDYVWPPAIALLVAAIYLNLPQIPGVPFFTFRAILWGVPPIVCFTFRRQPIRFSLCLGAWMITAMLLSGHVQLAIRRSFFGIYSVERLQERGHFFHRLTHGTTLHGQQDRDPARQREPLTYYARAGAMGQMFDLYGRNDAPRQVAVLGLGAGTLACYARPGETWTFYEIDPLVQEIATNSALFSYLPQCAPSARIILGDGRLSLQRAPNGGYGLLIVDTFTSDAIPVHLMSREAVQLYVSKLGPHGLLALNLSNRYLDLGPVIGNLARALGMVGVIRAYRDVPPDLYDQGITGSVWAVLAREDADVADLLRDARWARAPVSARLGVWTDDFSNVAGTFRNNW